MVLIVENCNLFFPSIYGEAFRCNDRHNGFYVRKPSRGSKSEPNTYLDVSSLNAPEFPLLENHPIGMKYSFV